MTHFAICPCGQRWAVDSEALTEQGTAAVVCPSCGASVELSATPQEEVPTHRTQPLPLGNSHRRGAALTTGDGLRTLPESASRIDQPPPVAIPGYEVLEELGRGGMGVVYRARHLALGRLVALKMILVREHAGPRECTRLRREAEAIARLQHPNIVQVFEVGEHQGQPYVALELVEGGSLAQQLGRRPQPPRDAARLTATLARAVDAVHGRGILHRDLKPGNILLDPKGTPKVTDFGLAKQIEGGSGSATLAAVCGTPSYMPPEQAGGRAAEVGRAADVYSLGAILYECLTGRPPFLGASAVETIMQVLHDEAVAVRRLQPNVPRDLETICLKCLEKDPRRRYASAAELADDLDAFLAGHPVKARPVGRASRAWRWCRRNPALAASVGIACLAAAAAVGLLAGLVIYQSASARELAAKQEATADALRQSQTHFADARRQYALLALDRGLVLCEDGDTSRGMLFLVAALDHAISSGDEQLQQFIRTSLGAWRRQMIPLRAVLPHHGGGSAAAVAPNGRRVTALSGGVLRQWGLASGQPIGEPIRLTIPAEGAPVPLDRPETVVAYSPDGKVLATAVPDGRVRLWDAATGRPCGELDCGQNIRAAFAFSPDGRVLATGCETTLRFWDAATGGPLGEPITQEATIRTLRFTPEGESILVLGNNGALGEARLYERRSGKPMMQFGQGQNVTWAAVLPGGKGVLTLAWEDRSGTTKASIQLWSMAGEPDGMPWTTRVGVSAVAVSADGKRIAVAQDERVQVLVINPGDTRGLSPAATGDANPVKHLGAVTSVAFSPDGSLLLTGSRDGAAQLWVTATGQRFGESLEHEGFVSAVDFSRDGAAMLTVSQDGHLRVWDARVRPSPLVALLGAPADQDSLPRLPPFAYRQPAAEVLLAPQGRVGVYVRRAALDADPRGVLQMWDPRTGASIGQPVSHRGGLREVAFSADGRTLAHLIGERSVAVYDTASGKPIGPPLHDQEAIDRFAISADGSRVVTARTGGAIRFWDTASGTRVGSLSQGKSDLTCLAFHPDGKTALTGHRDGTIHFLDATTAEVRPVRLKHPGWIEALHLSPDGRKLLSVGLASGSSFEGVALQAVTQLWDVEAAQPTGQPTAHAGAIDTAIFSPDSATLATASSDVARGIGQARLWDATTGQPLGAPLPHQDRVNGLAFSPGGRLLATGSGDRTARLWDVATSRQVGPPVLLFDRPQPVSAVAFSPDGKHLMAAGEGPLVQFWKVPESLAGSLDVITLWVQVSGGKQLDAAGGVRPLDSPRWLERRRLLVTHGGDPLTDPTMTAPLVERRKRFKELLLPLDGAALAGAGG